MLHYQAFKGKPRAFFKNEEFRIFSLIILLTSVFFAWNLKIDQSWSDAIRHGMFQVVSIMTCTGFVSANYDLWPGILKFSLLILMFIGGCACSTSGGLKVARAILTFKIVKRSIVQSISPNAVIPIKFNSKPIADFTIATVLPFFVLFLFLFFAGGIVLSRMEQCDLATAFSAALTSLSNCGPGLARVGAIENYAWLSMPSKWLLTFLMLAGRLELYAVLILFLPATWRR